MKKKNLKNLALQKESISKLNSQQINGGLAILWTLLWCKDEPAPAPHNPVPQEPQPVSWTCPPEPTGILSGCPNVCQ